MAIKHEELNKVIGLNIRTIRLQLGHTQNEFAIHLGVTGQQLQKYETGKDSISAGKLWMIAKITQQPINYFYDVIADILPHDNRQFNKVLRLVRAWNHINDNQRHAILDLLETLPESNFN